MSLLPAPLARQDHGGPAATQAASAHPTPGLPGAKAQPYTTTVKPPWEGSPLGHRSHNLHSQHLHTFMGIYLATEATNT